MKGRKHFLKSVMKREPSALFRWLKKAGKLPLSTDGWKFLVPDREEKHPLPFPDNSCIPYMRKVIEALLERSGKSYREFYPVILDFDAKDFEGTADLPDSGWEEDTDDESAEIFRWESHIEEYEREQELRRIYRQIDSVLRQITPELNRLMIYTSRAEYFEDFVQTMYEENGLLVELAEKSVISFPSGSFVIDFEWNTTGKMMRMQEDIFYLPIYQRPWEIVQNLDIAVPIGYNTVIVKGAVTTAESLSEDRFEREFYLERVL